MCSRALHQQWTCAERAEQNRTWSRDAPNKRDKESSPCNERFFVYEMNSAGSRPLFEKEVDRCSDRVLAVGVQWLTLSGLAGPVINVA